MGEGQPSKASSKPTRAKGQGYTVNEKVLPLLSRNCHGPGLNSQPLSHKPITVR